MHALLDKIDTIKIVYIDMQDLKTNKVYNTLTKLANQFHFTPPP